MKYYKTSYDIQKLIRTLEGRRLWRKTIQRLIGRGWLDEDKQLTEKGRMLLDVQNQPISEPLEKYLVSPENKYKKVCFLNK